MTTIHASKGEGKSRQAAPGYSSPMRGMPAVRPFGEWALDYRERGWPGEFPSARLGAKAPLLKGITGHAGIDLTDAQLAALVRKYAKANIGLRLPLDVLGIDVDAYDDRAGGRTLRALQARLGRLPRTWRSTSRAPQDPVSGIYLFRAPRKPDWSWVTNLGEGSGIEIVQRHHRFVTAPPSIHGGTGRPYRWWLGAEITEAPSPGDLPLLPVPWARYLRSAARYSMPRAADDAEASAWFRRTSGGKMCPLMREAAKSAAAEVTLADRRGGLHDVMTRATTHLCLSAAEGHRGLEAALEIVSVAFFASRRKRGLRSEWASAVNGARAQAAAREQATSDPCAELRGIRDLRPRREGER